MRALAPEILTLLQRRQGLLTHVLIWLTAKNRDTGAAEGMGLWTGADHQDFVIGGQTRTYFGAGNIIGMDMLTARAGLEVRMHKVTLSALSPEAVTSLRVHDPRLAPVQIHELYCDPTTELAVADPVRVFKGVIMEAPITQGADGGETVAEITMASSAWALTKGLTIKRSNGALEARASGDRFREYTDLGRAVETVWGEKRSGSQSGGGGSKPIIPDDIFGSVE